MNGLMIFEGNEVEVFELNGEVLFNPYHVVKCLDMADGTVKDHVSKMAGKQVIKLKNSDVGLTNFRKLNNAVEKGIIFTLLIFPLNKIRKENFYE